MSKATVRTTEPAKPQTAAGEQPKQAIEASPPPPAVENRSIETPSVEKPPVEKPAVEKSAVVAPTAPPAEPVNIQPAATALLPDNAVTPPAESATPGDAAARLRARFTLPARPGTLRFECRHPIGGFNGEECGITFVDGWGTTDVPARAHDALQNGVAVFDHQSDRLAYSSDQPENAARVLARGEERLAAANSSDKPSDSK